MLDEKRQGERRKAQRRREPKPWFSLYVDDFIGSETVTVCSNRALGCYMKLLCYQWRHKSIPADMKKLAAIVGERPLIFAKVWTELREKFPDSVHREGRLVNRRMEVERRHANSLSKTRAQTGRKGGAKAKQLLSNSAGLSLSQSHITTKTTNPDDEPIYDSEGRPSAALQALASDLWPKTRGKRS